MYQAFAEIAVDDLERFALDLAIRFGTAILVMAGVAAVIWKWFVRDRWESAVRRVMATKEESERDLAAEVVKLSDRIDALDLTVRNGLQARMIRVEEHVEKLVAGQARMEGRMEGIMQVMMQQQGGN